MRHINILWTTDADKWRNLSHAWYTRVAKRVWPSVFSYTDEYWTIKSISITTELITTKRIIITFCASNRKLFLKSFAVKFFFLHCRSKA